MRAGPMAPQMMGSVEEHAPVGTGVIVWLRGGADLWDDAKGPVHDGDLYNRRP